MEFDHNVKYFCMIRDLFHHMSVELVNKFENHDNYMIYVQNQKIRETFYKGGMNYNEFENLIQTIAQKLFEKGKYYLNLVITKNKYGDITNINFYTKMPEIISENQIRYRIKIKSNINYFKRKLLLYRLSNMNEYEIRDYKSAKEIEYFLEKGKKDKYKFLKITKDIYIFGDTEETTTYYHNYRTIKTKIWQVRFVENILKQLNNALEKIFNEKNIIKYNGITIEELYKYLEKLEENEISMSELSKKIMKLEVI